MPRQHPQEIGHDFRRRGATTWSIMASLSSRADDARNRSLPQIGNVRQHVVDERAELLQRDVDAAAGGRIEKRVGVGPRQSPATEGSSITDRDAARIRVSASAMHSSDPTEFCTNDS